MESKIEIEEDKIVYLGFAEKGKESDFNIKNFPSKLGGLPIWFLPLTNNINESFFKCNYCGKNLSFLLQIYCPLNNFSQAFHRILYVFYCDKCWKIKNNVKVLRINLPEESTYYDGENIKDISIIKEDKLIEKVNNMLKENLLEEYLITTSEEKKEASKLYFSYYNDCEEKSLKSNESLNDIIDDEDFNLKISNKNELNEYEDMKKQYFKENPNENLKNIEIETEEEKENDKILNLIDDNIFNLFSCVVNYNNTQILRYYRNNYFPLWFTKKNILTVSNIKCKNCKGEIEFEFQIMPYLFLLQKKISFIDIGTIVIYTCKNCCVNNKEGGFIEEYGFIQRTGENFRDLNDNDNKKENNDMKNEIIQKQYNFFKGADLNNIDEEGFVEVKQKKKNKMKKEEFKDDNNDDFND